MTLTRVAVAAIIALTPALGAAQSVDEAIAARRGFFNMVFLNFAPLAAMAKGERPFDAEAAMQASDNLKALGSMNLDALFPAGSSTDDKKGATRALPAIWSDQADFVTKVEGLRSGIAAMATAVEGGQSALGQGVQALGGSCAACHRAYRAREF